MAAQVGNQVQFLPQGVSSDEIIYQWRVNNNTRIVSLIRGEGDSKICHVFNAVLGQSTTRLVDRGGGGISPLDRDEISPLDRDEISPIGGFRERRPSRRNFFGRLKTYEDLIPEVVNTAKGPMCIFKHKNDRVVSKVHVRDGDTSNTVWGVVRTFTEIRGGLFLKREREFNWCFDVVILNIAVNRVRRIRVASKKNDIISVHRYLGNRADDSSSFSIFSQSIDENEKVVFDRYHFYEDPNVTAKFFLSNSRLPFSRLKIGTGHLRSTIESSLIRDTGFIFDIKSYEFSKYSPHNIERSYCELLKRFPIGEELETELESTPNPKWKIDGKEITLFQKDREVKYRVSTDRGENLYEGLVQTLQESDEVQRRIEELSTSCVFLEEDGNPFFGILIRRWNAGEREEVRLVQERDGLWWWLFNKDYQSSIRTNISIVEEKEMSSEVLKELFEERLWKVDDYFKYLNSPNKTMFSRKLEYGFTNRCCDSTKRYIRSLADKNAQEQRDALKNCSLKEIVFFRSSRGGRFLKVGLEPSYSAQCKIDPRVSVSNLMWAVTIVVVDAHAQLIIEGIAHADITFPRITSQDKREEVKIKKGDFFLFLTEFDGDSKYCNRKIRLNSILCRSGPAVVKIGVLNEKPRYDGRSETWKRPSEDIFKMFEQIVREHMNPQEYLVRNVLYMPGRESVAARSNMDSCITWLIEKVGTVGIYLPNLVESKIITVPFRFLRSEEYLEAHDPEK